MLTGSGMSTTAKISSAKCIGVFLCFVLFYLFTNSLVYKLFFFVFLFFWIVCFTCPQR